MRSPKYVLFFLMLPLLLLFSRPSASGREAKTPAKPVQKKTADTAQAPIEKKDVKIFIDKIEVEGRLEKPQVMLFLPGQTPEIDDIQIERSFMKNIFRPVENRVTVETKYRTDYTKNQKSVIEW